jgi:hypothetical protein
MKTCTMFFSVGYTMFVFHCLYCVACIYLDILVEISFYIFRVLEIVYNWGQENDELGSSLMTSLNPLLLFYGVLCLALYLSRGKGSTKSGFRSFLGYQESTSHRWQPLLVPGAGWQAHSSPLCPHLVRSSPGVHCMLR